ncbi:MAG: GNAT family N-acetyltransferase [Actinomycetota bacterium]
MGFEPIRTERLVLRPTILSDAEAAYQRRNLPAVARYQDWEMPYPRERAEQGVARLVAMDGPTDGEGWSLTVVEADAPETIVGDLYVGIRWAGRSAEVGYTFHPDHWGKGYATEATEAIIDYLFLEFGVSRVEASAHPDNVASLRVMEACGLVFEGLTRRSFWVGDECSDDILYGMPRADWDLWRSRPRHRPERVALVELTADNAEAVGRLGPHKSQERFVAPMGVAFRHALAPPSYQGVPVVPWYRAIEADGQIVGFLLAVEPSDTVPHPYLWQLVVDRLHQRRGIGSAALDAFEARCRSWGATAVETAWADGPGTPGPLYRARRYEPTGQDDDGTVTAVKRLD